MLKSPLFWKMSTLLGCILLLSIPLMLVRQLIVERADYRSDVVDALESSTSGSQKLAGPLIAIPVTETLTRVEGTKTVEYQTQWVHYWLPETLAVTGNQDVESRRIGIYEGSGTIISASKRILILRASRRSGSRRLRWADRFWLSASAMRAVLARLSHQSSMARGYPLSLGRVSTIAGRAFICRCRCYSLNKKRWILNSRSI